MFDEERYLVIVGARIRHFRQMKRMNQQELADKVGYTSKGMVSQVEAGKVNIAMDKLAKIANALGVTIYDLMKDDFSSSEDKKPEVVSLSPDPLEGLDAEDIRRVVEYINLLKGAKAWQNQNGTVKGGDIALLSTERQDPILLERQDEEDALK